jgi:hypothetical protein
LRLAYKIKGAIAIILVLLSIAFGVALFKAEDVGGQFLTVVSFPPTLTSFQRSSAVLEWVIAFGFTFYLLSYFWDLRLSKPGKLDNITLENPAYGQAPFNAAPLSQAA